LAQNRADLIATEIKGELTHRYVAPIAVAGNLGEVKWLIREMLGREEWQEKYGPQIKDQTEVGLI
jgi:hypothetical protein